jgi:hypothetical protein
MDALPQELVNDLVWWNGHNELLPAPFRQALGQVVQYLQEQEWAEQARLERAGEYLAKKAFNPADMSPEEKAEWARVTGTPDQAVAQSMAPIDFDPTHIVPEDHFDWKKFYVPVGLEGLEKHRDRPDG